MIEPKVRKSDDEWKLKRSEFSKKFKNNFYDPAFDEHIDKINQLEEVAWEAYVDGRKSPYTQRAGENYQDPNYQLSVEWIEAKRKIDEAQKLYENPDGPDRVLLISGSDRNSHTCPGEIAKSYRLFKIAEEKFKKQGIKVELLNLSEMASEYEKKIYPCKACVSTAMPLCHWPCSCYPNNSLNQVNDWMNDIYPMWVKSHGVMIITPVYWHQAPSALKLMIDRLVCADGGNPDPTTTQGKNALKAKEIELNGWNYPRHLEGRVYSVVVHGDATGVDELKSSLTSWLNEMMLIPSSIHAQIGRYIGYYGPYATSHDELDKDHAIMEEVKIACEALALNIKAQRAGKLSSQIPHLSDPRPK